MQFDRQKFEMANLSWIAYQPMQQKYKALRKYGLDQVYFLLPKYTDINNTVFYNYKTQHIILAVRGTDGSNQLGKRNDDLKTDLQLALGKLKFTKRYLDSKAVLNRIIADFPQIRIILTGHSLGAAIADQLSIDYKLFCVLFNTGSSPLSVSRNPLATRYTTNRPLEAEIDILSLSDAVYNPSILVDRKTDKNIHSIDNFTSWY